MNLYKRSIMAVLTLALCSCSAVNTHATAVSLPTQSTKAVPTTSTTTTSTTLLPACPSSASEPCRSNPLPTPLPITPFYPQAGSAQGLWTPAGRQINGLSAIYETTLIPLGGTSPAGIAWMDTGILSARLYSGSVSPGKGPYKYTAPIKPQQAASLVAAFNGGFMMSVAGGGYLTEGQVVYPLKTGAASLVIYANGSIKIGPWGNGPGLTMANNIVSVRQNLSPLVTNGVPTALAATPNWQIWGATCSATSCVGPGIEHQWRSGVGITADGAAVYVAGPSLDPLQLAQLLVRAGAVNGMELDINPDWPDFATYNPQIPGGVASPQNGSKLLATTVQGPWTFFEPTWARDFFTMSARP
ncbi:MAG: hypothetical protein HKL84_10850 [Acidimicrobiaceae bacterium]|nr:hypothetical protein [Acidimicrobiaceae bacterium]